jgi:hypothetical protein
MCEQVNTMNYYTLDILMHVILRMRTIVFAWATTLFQEERQGLSTAETVNGEVFQNANGVKRLMECNKANDDASKTKVSVYSFS